MTRKFHVHKKITQTFSLPCMAVFSRKFLSLVFVRLLMNATFYRILFSFLHYFHLLNNQLEINMKAQVKRVTNVTVSPKV